MIHSWHDVHCVSGTEGMAPELQHAILSD